MLPMQEQPSATWQSRVFQDQWPVASNLSIWWQGQSNKKTYGIPAFTSLKAIGATTRVGTRGDVVEGDEEDEQSLSEEASEYDEEEE